MPPSSSIALDSVAVNPPSPLHQSSKHPALDKKADANALLSLNDVSYVIGNNTLVSHVSMQIGCDEMVSLIGPNGAGKSTLVKLILGLLEPSSGSITKGAHLRLGYVPQRFTVPPILPLRVSDLLKQAWRKCLTKQQKSYVFEQLKINDLLTRQMRYLSGGETQRVLLARALLEKPQLLILDEPMQGLDPETEAWLYHFIDNLPEFLRCAMLVISHDLHWVLKGSRRVICLNKHICCEGQPSELVEADEFQRLFGHRFEQPYLHQPHQCQHNVNNVDLNVENVDLN